MSNNNDKIFHRLARAAAKHFSFCVMVGAAVYLISTSDNGDVQGASFGILLILSMVPLFSWMDEP